MHRHNKVFAMSGLKDSDHLYRVIQPEHTVSRLHQNLRKNTVMSQICAEASTHMDTGSYKGYWDQKMHHKK